MSDEGLSSGNASGVTAGPGEALTLPRLIFVTDPLCSWCWGMADEVEAVRRELAGQMAFDLWLGGINIESRNPVSSRALVRFQSLWQNVGAVTGQSFSMRLPDSESFVYNSLPVCRGIAAMRALTGAPPFDYLLLVQKAFFIDARDTTSLDVLVEVASDLGVDQAAFRKAYQEDVSATDLMLEIRGARQFGTQALPAVLADGGDGPGLLAGGYVAADFLLEQVQGWLGRQGIAH